MVEANATPNSLPPRWLLVDSCAAEAVLAAGHGPLLLAKASCAGRGFSAAWPALLRDLMTTAGWSVSQIDVIGVVTGPGSFTGVRVGLAAAKGLCETLGVKMIALSRMEVLAVQSGSDALVVLDAGRGEFYVRDAVNEALVNRDALLSLTEGREVVTADASVCEVLHAALLLLPALDTASALLLERWAQSDFADIASVDANYVRGEREIFARKASADGVPS